MFEVVVLSKIAVRANETRIGENLVLPSVQNAFEYNQKRWHFLETFFNDGEELLEFIQLYHTGKIKDVIFVESDDGGFLLAKYCNIRRYKRKKIAEQIIDNILKIIFPNFQTFYDAADKNEDSSRQKQIKAYVTTKLFDALQKSHNIVRQKRDVNTSVTLPSRFLPTLCRYQKNCVLWLLSREMESDSINAFFEKLLSKDGETVVYKYFYSLYLQNEEPNSITLPPGGILADEMGLGKTVEILALILINTRNLKDTYPFITNVNENVAREIPSINSDIEVFCLCTSHSKKNLIQCRKCFLWQHTKCVQNNRDEDEATDSKTYLCPSCWRYIIAEYGLIKSNATFIVSPNTIKLQWLSEIKRHIEPNLRVFLYNGVNTGKWISPYILSKYDIVLADYNALRNEIYFTDENYTQRKTRNQPRTLRLHSPLLMIEWWRVCLDEAQMVESNTSKIASLVRMIPAINRWAVTGTPIHRSLDDLPPLLKFIGLNEVAEVQTWNHMVNEFLLEYKDASEPESLELIKVLQKCMWRTSKSQIADELQIPPQQERVHFIQFDNLEKLFYNEQHNDCQVKFQGNVNKFTARMSEITPRVMKIILQPFLKIRQTCTMPVVNTSRTNNAAFGSHKKFLQPTELHDYMKSTNEISCKSQLRTMASSHNGMAAIYFIQQKYDDALRHYKSVLKLANQYTNFNITLDTLLQIHALYNLMEVKKCQDQMASNLEAYENQYNTLEWKYLTPYSTTLTSVMATYSSALAKVENYNLCDNVISFVSESMSPIQEQEISSFLYKVYEECVPRFGNTSIKLHQIQGLHSLLIVLEQWLTKVQNALRKTSEGMQSLKYFTENVKPRSQVSSATWRNIQELVHNVYDCHLSELLVNSRAGGNKTKPAPKRKKKTKCIMCILRNNINTFECLLFDKVIDKSSNFTEGMENPSFEMFLCKLTLSFIKNKQSLGASIDTLESCCSTLDKLQILCKRLIKLWIEIEFTVKAYDELNMCKMRISLKTDTEDKSTYKIDANEMEQYLLNYQSELMAAETEFVNKLARLRYIYHLNKSEELAACPICRLLEMDQYAVLECGHHICLHCLQSIRQYTKGSTFKCSVCRNDQRSQDVFYVEKRQGDQDVKGNFSSKITFLIRLILKLQKEHHEANGFEDDEHMDKRHLKILIFSEWIQILNAIGMALNENNIAYRLDCTPKTLEEFKNPQLGITCLLMPFTKGSKGLNLVEATHVFLVEPILNPGEELQAIGRVHRFGQRRTTTIHRLIMKDSIEENIFNFISASSPKVREHLNGRLTNKWNFENVSLDDFSKLFILSTNIMCK